jgi:hypothetical protein
MAAAHDPPRRPGPLGDPVLASRVFGAYLAVAGAGLLVAPGVLLPLMGLPVPGDAWIRVVGLLTGILGLYFLALARPGERRFFQATVLARLVFFTGVLALWLFGHAPATLLAFGLADLAGAAWTQLALARSAAGGPVRPA